MRSSNIVKFPHAVSQEAGNKLHAHKTQNFLTVFKILPQYNASKLERLCMLFIFSIKSRFSARCGRD